LSADHAEPVPIGWRAGPLFKAGQGGWSPRLNVPRPSFKSRSAVRKASVAILALLVIGGALALSSEVGSNNRSSASKATAVQVVARAIDANGNPVTNVTYRLGQEVLLSVTVPDSTSPVSLHQVFSGRAYGELPWNVTATHYTYTIDSAPADPADMGIHQVYAVVTFADGTTARSNNVTMTVTS